VKITRVTVFHRNLELAEPYWLSGGRLRFDVLDATFVKLETDDGLTGWGEGTPWGHTYLPAHGPGLRAGLETVAPRVLGLDPRKTSVIEQAMDLALPGYFYAKAPIDMACWDIAGQTAGLPIADLLGGRLPEGSADISSVSSGSPETMEAGLQAYRDRGNFVHSAKVGGDSRADIERIRHLESVRQPGERIIYDVNRAWNRRQALEVMNAVGDLGVTIEQPCENLDDLAALRPLTRLPVSVDESLVTLVDACRIARNGLAEMMNIKTGRVGGLTRARRIVDVALAHGIECAVMATAGSILADTEAAHLAQTVPLTHRVGAWSCQDMLTDDITDGGGARNVDGVLTVSESPGLGVYPNEDALGNPVAVYG